MCIDYINLNGFCPKDFYTLYPPQDQNIEAISRYEVLSFKDLYKGCHQILIQAKRKYP